MATTTAAPGNTRYTIETSIEQREIIAALAKKHRITQGEVVACMIEVCNDFAGDNLRDAMTRRGMQKKASRKAKRDADAALMNAINNMPADKRAALLGETK